MKNIKANTQINCVRFPGKLLFYNANFILSLIFIFFSTVLFSQTENKIHKGGVIPISKEEYEKIPKVNRDTLRKYSNPDLYLASSSKSYVMLVTPPVGDQGQDKTCVGWAVGYTALGILTYPKYNCWYLAKRSPRYVYNQLADPNTCSGISMTAALNLVKTQGSCSWNSWPYTYGNCSTQPNTNQRSEASKNKALNYVWLNSTNVSDIKNALGLGHPVIVSYYLYDSFYNAWNWNKGNWTSFSPDENQDGLHAVVIVGYDDSSQRFKVQNSMGPGGDEGFFWVTYSMVIDSVFNEAYVLYGMNLAQYYEEVTGLSLVCSSPNSTFSLSNRPSGTTIIWAKSSSLQYVSGQGTDNYVVKGLSASDAGWVQPTITKDANTCTLYRRNVWVGTPKFNISGPSEGCPNVEYMFEAIPRTYSNPSLLYSWAIYPNDGNIITSNGGTYAYITFNNPYSISGYDVKVRAQNTCGLGDYSIGNIWIHECYYFKLSPNPASDIVTITRVVSEGSNTKVTSSGENTIYNIKIIDYYGTLHYQTTKSGDSFTIPVSGLKDGNYILQITIGDKISSLKLVVKH